MFFGSKFGSVLVLFQLVPGLINAVIGGTGTGILQVHTWKGRSRENTDWPNIYFNPGHLQNTQEFYYQYFEGGNALYHVY